MEMYKGTQLPINATVRDAVSVPDPSLIVTWTSSNTGVAIVTPHSIEGNQAIVYAISTGSAIITATYGVITTTLTINVIETITPTSIELSYGPIRG